MENQKTISRPYMVYSDFIKKWLLYPPDELSKYPYIIKGEKECREARKKMMAHLEAKGYKFES